MRRCASARDARPRFESARSRRTRIICYSIAMKRAFLSLPCSLLSVLANSPAASVDDNWAQWRGPDGLGVSTVDVVSRGMGAGQEHRVEDARRRPRSFVAHRLAGPHLPHDVDRRRQGAGGSQGARSISASTSSPATTTPTASAPIISTRSRCSPSTPGRRKPALGADGVRRRDVRQPPQQEHLRLVDDGDRWQVGLCVLRVGRTLRVRLRRQAALEEVPRRDRARPAWGRARRPSSSRTCSSSSAIRRWATALSSSRSTARTAARCGGRRRTTRRSWATPLIVRTAARVEMITAGAEVGHRLRPQDRPRALARQRNREPSDSERGGRGRAGVSLGGQFRQASDGDQAGWGRRPHDSPAVVWRYRKGAAYVPSPILRGPYLYLMSDTGIITCIEAETGTVVVRGRPAAGARDLHGVARRLWRQAARRRARTAIRS